MRRVTSALQYAGVVAAVFGLSKLHAVVHGYDFTGSSRLGWAVAYAGLLAVATYGAGLPDLAWGRSTIATAAVATASAALGMSLCQLAVGSALLPRFTVFGSAAVLVPWSALVGAFARDADARAEDRERIVFVGTPVDAALLNDELGARPERPAALVVALEPDDARPRRTGEEPLVDAVIAHGASVLVLAREAQDAPLVVAQASTLHESGVRVRSLTDFYAEWLGKLPIAELERLSLMFDIAEVHQSRYARAKRMYDVVVGVVGAVVLAVVTPFVALGNLVANRGPLFFRQTRIGRNGREFAIWKFRTMRPHDGTLPDAWTTTDDPRVTGFGRFLRRTHLDELPQALNIVRGDLAVVGPRPEQPHYVVELSHKLPYYGLRHLVRPGLTGWAQVKYGYAGSERDALEKLQYEFFYLGHQSLWFDARIVGRTVRSVIGTQGR